MKTLEGQVVREVRNMSQEELEDRGWIDRHGTLGVIVFESGDVVYPSCDDEGNAPGVLFGTIKGNDVYVMAETDQ